MKQHIQNLLQESDKTRLLLSLYVGLFGKIFSVFCVIVILLLWWIVHSFVEVSSVPNKVQAADNDFVWVHTTEQFIRTLVYAPIVENIEIPIIFWFFGLFIRTPILPILVITLIGYYLHGSSIPGIAGALAFLVYSAYYAALKRVTTTWKAYGFTVIAHFVTNVFALGLSFL